MNEYELANERMHDRRDTAERHNRQRRIAKARCWERRARWAAERARRAAVDLG